MCLCDLVEGVREEAGKENVVERRSDLRTTEVAAVDDGGIEEAAMRDDLE